MKPSRAHSGLLRAFQARARANTFPAFRLSPRFRNDKNLTLTLRATSPRASVSRWPTSISRSTPSPSSTRCPIYTPPLDAKGQPADAGGNGFILNGTPAKLHAYWDDIFDLGQPAGSDSSATARTLATALEAKAHLGPMGMSRTAPKS